MVPAAGNRSHAKQGRSGEGAPTILVATGQPDPLQHAPVLIVLVMAAVETRDPCPPFAWPPEMARSHAWVDRKRSKIPERESAPVLWPYASRTPSSTPS